MLKLNLIQNLEKKNWPEIFRHLQTILSQSGFKKQIQSILRFPKTSKYFECLEYPEGVAALCYL